MNNIDIKSFLIGVLGTSLVFILISADDKASPNGNLGDIVVNSITIMDAKQEVTGIVKCKAVTKKAF